MSTISRFSMTTISSQFNKRDHTQNQGGDGSDAKSLVAIAGLVIAALTLLAAMVPLFRCQRFYRWLSSILSFVKKALQAVTLAGHLPTTVDAMENLSSIPVVEIPIPSRVFIYNDYSNAYFVGTRSNTSPYYHNMVTREDGRVPQDEESLGPRRPESAATRLFS
ncbi:hypothetical protein HOY82DRAFT_602994 [Tuber indicum]|nr:hypothetical protein HOY82DRAFT_602994 [Tuber indicum]